MGFGLIQEEPKQRTRTKQRKRNIVKPGKQRFDQQYCSKHDQHYADYLNRCPICWGEEMAMDRKNNQSPVRPKRKKFVRRK